MRRRWVYTKPHQESHFAQPNTPWYSLLMRQSYLNWWKRSSLRAYQTDLGTGESVTEDGNSPALTVEAPVGSGGRTGEKSRRRPNFFQSCRYLISPFLPSELLISAVQWALTPSPYWELSWVPKYANGLLNIWLERQPLSFSMHPTTSYFETAGNVWKRIPILGKVADLYSERRTRSTPWWASGQRNPSLTC